MLFKLTLLYTIPIILEFNFVKMSNCFMLFIDFNITNNLLTNNKNMIEIFKTNNDEYLSKICNRNLYKKIVIDAF